MTNNKGEPQLSFIRIKHFLNVFYKIGYDKISGRLFANSIGCCYFCYGSKIYGGNNKNKMV